MINKIIASFFFVELLVALTIGVYWSMNNIPVHTIELGSPFLSYVNSCSIQLNEWNHISIPDIPSIPMDLFNNANAEGNFILDWFISFVNGFFTFINGLIVILNVLILAINTIFDVLKFLFIFLKNLETLVSQLETA